MRSKEEIKKTIKDYMTMLSTEFCEKYCLDTLKEAIGFVKALRWVLELA